MYADDIEKFFLSKERDADIVVGKRKIKNRFLNISLEL